MLRVATFQSLESNTMNDRRPAGGWNRWQIVGLALAVLGAGLAFVFARDGWSDEGLRAAIRVTARCSFLLFLSAFSASSLALLLPSGPTRWQRLNRRYLGISFALSHLIHGAAIVTLAVRTGGGSLTAQMAGLIGGGVIYGFILFMLATSFDRSAAWVGPRVWKTVHTIGGYLIFVTFLTSYVGKAAESLIYLPQVVLLVAVLGLRIARRIRRSRRG